MIIDKNILNTMGEKIKKAFKKVSDKILKKTFKRKKKFNNNLNNISEDILIDKTKNKQEILKEYQNSNQKGILKLEDADYKVNNSKISKITDKVSKKIQNEKITKVYTKIDKNNIVFLSSISVIAIIMLLIVIINLTLMPQTIKDGLAPIIKYKNNSVKIVAKTTNNIENIFKLVNPDAQDDEENPNRIPLESEYKDAIYTKINYKDFKGNNSTINANIPEFNLEKNQETQKVSDYIKEIDKKIKEEIGNSSVQNNMVNLNYQGYNYKNYVSIVLKYTDKQQESIKTFNYDFFEKRIITIEDYFKKRNIPFSNIKKEIIREAKNRKQNTPDFNNFLIDEIGNIYIYTSPDKYIYLEIQQ